ncbi:DNA cytosine methyltransferase [Paenirhodobacter populi]|uniref:DNA (cytosine-5-)-methyltransferase n=1 Tax=Paenirhodobacter populi TaxID=2306993 RepID=A0A443J687_9RHOB|nr:DNA cytosine methyltransferase [Sinirhodobacter populi]
MTASCGACWRGRCDVVLPPRPRNGLSLCAGTGGLDLGVMLAEPGFHTRCWVEWAEYPRDCIIAAQRAGYFAPAPIWDDVTTFDGRPWRGRIDTILAGFSCQPVSLAGKRKGADDERYLWPEVARIIREIEPDWVFLENVPGLIPLGGEAVLRELWEMGWTPACGLFSAGETGATHERQRVFIVAHRDRQQLRPDRGEPGAGTDRGNDAGRSCGTDLVDTPSVGRGEGRPEPEVRSGRDTAASAGGAVDNAERVGQSTKRHDHGRDERHQFGATGQHALADAGGAGPQGRERPGPSGEWHWPPAHGSAAERGRPRLHPPGPADMDGWRHALAARPDLAPSLGLNDALIWANRLSQDLETADRGEGET